MFHVKATVWPNMGIGGCGVDLAKLERAESAGMGEEELLSAEVPIGIVAQRAELQVGYDVACRATR